ncbi:MAG: fibronectin type III domain-containing protein, partial [Candidatus Omnitrophica bacterium]|nr:fibronectin type III domain-containing protein [Candidatus Omnitrophota bacterium]
GEEINWMDADSNIVAYATTQGLYTYNLTTGVSGKFSASVSTRECGGALAKGIVVFSAMDNNEGKVFQYNIASQQLKQIDTATVGEPKYHLTHDAKYAAWIRLQGNDNQQYVHLLDLENGQEKDFPTGIKAEVVDEAHLIYPGLSDGKLVYESNANQKREILLFDTAKNTTLSCGADIYYQRVNPVCRGEKISFGIRYQGKDTPIISDYPNKMELYLSALSSAASNPVGKPALYANYVAFPELSSNDKETAKIDLYKFTFAPQVISITPGKVIPGETVIIRGRNFGFERDSLRVQFANNVRGEIVEFSDEQITCRVPVQAVNGKLQVINLGGGSNSVDYTIDNSLRTPTNLSATAVSKSQVNLNWSDVSNFEDGFKIERKTSSTNFALCGTAQRNATSFSDTGLTANTQYTYRIKAYNAAGESPYSQTVNVKTKSIDPPPAPYDFSAVIYSDTMIRLTFSVQNTAKCRIERSTNGTDFTLLELWDFYNPSFTGSAGMTDRNLAKGTYYYRVQALNAGGESGYTGVVQVNLSNAISVGGVSPSAVSVGTGSGQSYSASFFHPNRYEDLANVYIAFGANSVPRCAFKIDVARRIVYMSNDAGNGWSTGVSVGSDAWRLKLLQNSYAWQRVNNMSMRGSGKVLTIGGEMSFKAASAGMKNVYLRADAKNGATTGWVKAGTWTINRQPPRITRVARISSNWYTYCDAIVNGEGFGEWDPNLRIEFYQNGRLVGTSSCAQWGGGYLVSPREISLAMRQSVRGSGTRFNVRVININGASAFFNVDLATAR